MNSEKEKKSGKFWRPAVLLVLAVGFFVAASGFNYYTQAGDFVKWLSPDETANYIFTKLYGQVGDLTIFEKYNLYANDIIHPRSFRSDYGQLKPVSFLGITLIYGKIASLTDYKIIPYLTPFFGSLVIIFYFLLLKEIFGANNALVSAALLAFFPPFIYYSSRSMFHNVLFVGLLVISFYFSLLMVKRRRGRSGGQKILSRFFFPALAGAFMGLAIITRTSELLWLAPVLLLLWLANIRRIGFIRLIVYLSALVSAFLPVLYWNQILYDSPWRGGYPEMNQSIATLVVTGSELAKATVISGFERQKMLFDRLKQTIFFFGFDSYKSLKMFFYYFTKMFSWLFWLSLLGFISFAAKFKKITRRQLVWLAALSVASAILVFYYGSWEFHDNPDVTRITIGNSYVRYWLPIYLGALPFASLFIIRLTRLLKRPAFILSARIFIVGVIAVLSIQFVLIGSEEGLVYTAVKQLAAKAEQQKIIGYTENNSVIITQYHDKLLFPERKVIVGLLNDDRMNLEYAKLAERLPLYYYNFTFPAKDLAYLNQTKLSSAGLAISPLAKLNKDFTLYRISKAKNKQSENGTTKPE